ELRRRFPRTELRAVLGVADRDDDASPFGETRLHALAPEAMAAEMASADLAIATPSTVSWELAAVGTPTILCRVFENQAPTARYFRALGAFPVLEGTTGLGDALAMLERLPLEDLTRRARLFAACCDGRGAARLAERLVLAQP